MRPELRKRLAVAVVWLAIPGYLAALFGWVEITLHYHIYLWLSFLGLLVFWLAGIWLIKWVGQT